MVNPIVVSVGMQVAERELSKKEKGEPNLIDTALASSPQRPLSPLGSALNALGRINYPAPTPTSAPIPTPAPTNTPTPFSIKPKLHR